MDVTFETKHKNKAGTHEWLTPPYIINDLGPFDLDPCFSEPHPFETAKKYFTEKDNGLIQEWNGFVWCNPPYGKETKDWLKKCSEYKNCLVLIFARTETRMFKDFIWDKAKAIFFFYGRLNFYTKQGIRGQSAGAPSCIIAYNDEGIKRLKKLNYGKLILL